MLKSIIPNVLTLANLASGLLALVAIFSGQYVTSAWLVGAALLFDFLDGFTARALKVHSELGLQLDSLADLVTFGVVPGMFIFRVFQKSGETGEPLPDFLPYLALLIPIFSALRLAKFNIDTRQTEHFVGLPVPANTILLFSLGLWALYTSNPTTENILLHPFFLTFIILISALLLVAELPLMSLKIKNLSFQENKGRLALILGMVVLFLVFRARAFAFIIPLYLVLSRIFKPK